jgi:hypothetical protein
MAQYWFRPNRNGDGLNPASWQGWAITAGIPLAIVALNILLSVVAGSLWVAIALPVDALGVIALIMVAKRKTEGDWRWSNSRWVRNRDADRSP